MGFSRQEYWRGLPFSSPMEFPNAGIKPTSLESPALASGFFTITPPGKPISGVGKAFGGVGFTLAAIGFPAFTPLLSCFHQVSTGCCPHVSLVLQGKAALVLTPRGGPWLVLTAQYPGLCDWRVSQGSICWGLLRRKLLPHFFFFGCLFFHRGCLEGALFFQWTRMSLLLAATLWPRGEAALSGGSLGQKAEGRDGKKQTSWIHHCKLVSFTN